MTRAALPSGIELEDYAFGEGSARALPGTRLTAPITARITAAEVAS